MVALESIAAGTPVIAFRTGGIPEVVSRKNSFLIDPTETALFKALQPIVKGNLSFRKPVRLAKKNIPMKIPYRMATLTSLLRKPPPK
jgi:glycosyltransferase involved in cell wall biosynthesis